MKNLSLLFTVFLLLHLTTFAQWTQKADIPTARSLLSSCTLDGKIYVIGGTETNAYGPSVGTMEVYDPFLDSWDTTKAPMPTSRVELGACAVIGKIYAIGGADNHSTPPLGMVEEYDPLTNTWDNTTKEPMPTPRKGAAYGVIDNIIYVAGGSAVANYTAYNKLEIYDPETDTWDTTKAPMPISMYQPQGAVINADTWSRVADLNDGRVGHTTNGIAGKIYAIGGDRQPPIVRSVEEYDPNTDIWTRIDSLPSVKLCHTASVFENKIYLISGSTTSLMAGFTPTSTVYSFAPTILNVQSPNGGEVWVVDESEDITWTSQNVNDVMIELSVDNGTTWITIENSTSNTGTYSWTVTAQDSSDECLIRISDVDSTSFNDVSDGVFTIDIISDIEDLNQGIPTEFQLVQNYPNPFNPSTTIRYSIPQSSNVVIKVFDILGNEIETLVNEEKSTGTYEITWYAENLPSGVYFYRLQASNFVEIKKMLLLR
jgi:hypothetical protein